MLSHIHLRNFAIIETLDLELKTGMTALTGETGAGKSILIDAIGLVLGDRAESGVVRHGADKAEITLTVELDDTPSAQAWLAEQDLSDDNDDDQCILRRVITANGKSRAWINGSPCNLSMLRQLGSVYKSPALICANAIGNESFAKLRVPTRSFIKDAKARKRLSSGRLSHLVMVLLMY